MKMLNVEFINEDDSIVFTKHGDERRVVRNNQVVGVPRERIENIVRKNFHRIKSFWGRFNTFVFRNPVDGLNVAGELVRDGDDWTFKVVTVMFKHDFKPYFKDYVVKVNEERNLMMFESFMEASNVLYEIASEEGGFFEYKQSTLDEGDGEFQWEIAITEDGRLIDVITLRIEYSKDPIASEMGSWTEKFKDFIGCLDMFDSNDDDQVEKFDVKFNSKKWSRIIDIAEVSMRSKITDYEPTGYGKSIALKLLRTRFKIIKEWIEAYKPDVFLSKPMKESDNDTRRLRIYELYFRKNLPDYDIFTKEINGRVFSTDILVCLSKRISQGMLAALEADVESAIY